MGDFLYNVLMSGDSVIVWVATLVVGLIGKYVLAKIGNETVKKYVGRALDEVYDATGEIHQTYVKALKEANADGKLTAEEKAEAKRMALDVAKANIGSKGLARLGRILGIDSVDDWLDTKVEASVAKLNGVAVPKP
jgi:hypothetical protein